MTAPTIINQKAVATIGQITLTWGLSTQATVTAVRAYIKPHAASTWSSVDLPPTTRSHIFPLLKAGPYDLELRPIVGGAAVTLATTVPTPPPPPPPPASGLIVGICGLTGGNNGALNLSQAKSAMALTHATRDRIDADSVLNERVTAGAAAGIKSLVIADDLSVAAVVALVNAMKPLGLTDLEFGNEVYYSNSFDGKTYGAQYRAAHDALEGLGITLIANAYTGEPWTPAVVSGAGMVPDAWSLHPYGGMGEKNMAENEGWQIVPQFMSDAKAGGYYAPLHITEVGQPIWTGTDGRKAVTATEQAAAVTQYIHDSAAWGVVSFYYFAMAEYTEPGGAEDPGGYGLYSHDLMPRPSAAAFGAAVSALT